MAAIMTPAMLASWILGLVLVAGLGIEAFRDSHWLLVKIFLAAVLSGVHLLLVWHLRAFAKDRNRYSARYFRILNEVPTVLMIAIVVMVVVRPF
jgi:putative membrane protein